MKKLCGEHVGSVAVLAQCKAAVRERRERTRREPRGGDLEDPLLIASRRAKWPLAIQLETTETSLTPRLTRAAVASLVTEAAEAERMVARRQLITSTMVETVENSRFFITTLAMVEAKLHLHSSLQHVWSALTHFG